MDKEDKSRDGFVFYRSWWIAIVNLPRDVQGEVLTAIIEYGLYGETTEQLKPIAKAMLELIRPQIDANYNKYLAGKKGAEYGKRGGRPRKNNLEENPSETPLKPQQNPSETPKYKDKYKDKYITTPKGDIGGTAGMLRKEVLEEFFSKKTVLESFCMNNRTSVDELRGLADQIFDEWELISEKDLSEKHLLNTLRIKLNLRNENTGSSGSGQRYSGRRNSKLPPEPGCGLIED